jgi:ribulose kinase
MNSKGHTIDSIYMSGTCPSHPLTTTNTAGSQAKNAPLMQLLSTVLQMPVLIPPHPSAAVVLGSAMLARFAHEQTASGEITTQAEAQDRAAAGATALWDVMVDMTPAAARVNPRSGPDGERERRLLDVKYEIFLESCESQRRWRKRIAEAAV